MNFPISSPCSPGLHAHCSFGPDGARVTKVGLDIGNFSCLLACSLSDSFMGREEDQ